ncbi:hypothetical protein [Streptomyces sp. NPDC001389]|uniref:hypothetical protein n=1 Tax=unclassified Streptomyces TaxID=2593676 RepID=UPI00368F2673
MPGPYAVVAGAGIGGLTSLRAAPARASLHALDDLFNGFGRPGRAGWGPNEAGRNARRARGR